MADTIFTTSDATATAPCEPESVLYTTGVDGDGKVILEQSGFFMDSAGVLTSGTGTIRIPGLVERTVKKPHQTVTSTSTITQIDLALGNRITLHQNVSTMIQFTNLPLEGIRKFRIERIHDATANVYTLEFVDSPPGYSWYSEGSLFLNLSQTSNGEDVIYGWVDSVGNVITRMPTLRMELPSASLVEATATVIETRTGQRSKGREVGVVVPGQTVTTNADKTLNLCSTTIDGVESFTSVLQTYDVAIAKDDSSIAVIDSSDVLTVDLTKNDFIVLNQNTDITSIVVINADPDVTTECAIWRIKDNTATPRTIVFDPELLKYDMTPLLTQSASGVDMIVITSNGGINTLGVFNYFG